MEFEMHRDDAPVSLDAAARGFGGVTADVRAELARIEGDFPFAGFKALELPEPDGSP